MSDEEFRLSPESDRRLSRMLELWAAPRRMTPERDEAMRQAILQAPNELDREWRARFRHHVSAAMKRSFDASRDFAYPVLVVRPSSESDPAPLGMSRLSGLTPYLRLA